MGLGDVYNILYYTNYILSTTRVRLLALHEQNGHAQDSRRSYSRHFGSHDNGRNFWQFLLKFPLNLWKICCTFLSILHFQFAWKSDDFVDKYATMHSLVTRKDLHVYPVVNNNLCSQTNITLHTPNSGLNSFCHWSSGVFAQI